MGFIKDLLNSIFCRKLIIVENGKSKYGIAGNYNAVKLLNNYFKDVTGIELTSLSGPDISIWINQNMDKEEYSISIDQEDIIINGGTELACIYGVNYFAETFLGIKKYSPIFKIIPKLSKIEIPKKFSYKDKPYNNFRVVLGEFRKNEEYREWTRTHMLDEMFNDDYYFVHTLTWLLDEKLFNEHPEYFALVDGKRTITQPCLSHPDVFNIVIKELKTKIDKQPNVKVWSVSQGDNYDFCQCENCKKVYEEEGGEPYGRSGTIIRFTNKVAEVFPDKIISTLVYLATRYPCKTTTKDNVQVMLTTIQEGRGLPIKDEPRCYQFVWDIAGWSKLTKNLFLWDYECNFRHLILPFPNFYTLAPNIRFFCDNGAKMHLQQMNSGVGHEFSELKSYLISKMLWNPYQDENVIIIDFLNGYYGDAAPYIKEYIDLLYSNNQKIYKFMYHYADPYEFKESFLTKDCLNEYYKILSNAESAVKNDKDRLLHVQTVRLQLEYASLELEYGNKEELKNSFKCTCKQLGDGTVMGSVTINENNVTWKEYINS